MWRHWVTEQCWEAAAAENNNQQHTKYITKQKKKLKTKIIVVGCISTKWLLNNVVAVLLATLFTVVCSMLWIL